MISREEFKELGKKYGLKTYDSIFRFYLTYIKDGIGFAVLDLDNGIVIIKTKFFMGKPYGDKVANDVEELEELLKTALNNLKLENIRQKMDLIEGDF